MPKSAFSSSVLTPVLIAGCLVLVINFAIRSSFGVFQIPISNEFNWLRQDLSIAIAIQNLAWGIGQPIFGFFAERFGTRLAIVLGALCYAMGLVLSSFAVTPIEHQLLEIFVGFGIAGTGFGVILAVVSRAATEQYRSLSLGIATAAGSVGQVIGPPIAEILLRWLSWQTVFVIFAVAILCVLLLLPMVRDRITQSTHSDPVQKSDEAISTALRKAIQDPSYTLIFVGFFSCGYQLAFLTAHFPAFVTELCGPIAPDGVLSALGVRSTSTLGAVALSFIGLANIAGTIYASVLGHKFPKKYLLSAVYTARTIISIVFISFPITPATVILFSILMGALWLATVPLTVGLIGYIYGLRYVGTLYGIVFFSHQLGGFFGVWLGGLLYDVYGGYTFVWWIGILVGAFSALVHLPIREIPLNVRAQYA